KRDLPALYPPIRSIILNPNKSVSGSGDIKVLAITANMLAKRLWLFATSSSFLCNGGRCGCDLCFGFSQSFHALLPCLVHRLFLPVCEEVSRENSANIFNGCLDDPAPFLVIM